MSEKTSSSGFFLDETASPWTSRFTHVSLVHQGNVFEVWRAQRYGRWFALKCLRAELHGKTTYEQMLQKEYSILLHFHNEAVVNAVSFEQMEDGRFAIVEEWVEGTTLTQWLETGRGKAERETIALQIADVLCCLHDHGVVYRDLKPDNIMVTAYGKRVKLIDFNLADEAASTIMKRPCGTPEYADPESKEDTVPSELSDIYSFGRVLQDIGVFHRTSRRCMASRSKRLPTAESARKSLNDERKRRKWLARSVAAAILALCFAAPIWWLAHKPTELVVKQMPAPATAKSDTHHVTVYDTIPNPSEAALLSLTTENPETSKSEIMERDKEIERLIAEGKAYEDVNYKKTCAIAFHFDTLTDRRYLRPDAAQIIQTWNKGVSTFIKSIMKPRIELTDKDLTLINVTLTYYHNQHDFEMKGEFGTSIIDRYNSFYYY